MNKQNKNTISNIPIKSKDSTAGITLIALVITIIVLLILAGIAISMLSGENGILRKAVESKEKTEIASKQEEATLLSMELRIAKSTGENIEDYFEESNYNILNNEINTDDVIYITEGKYAIENTTNNKKYIIDENLDVSEATEIINILQIVVKYINENSLINTIKYISEDVTTSDNTMKEILGENYDTNKFHFVIMSKRLLCYPDDKVSMETLKKCEKLGIYLWGDVTEDLVVNDFDYDYLNDNLSLITSKGSRLIIEADVQYTSLRSINSNDINSLYAFVNTKYRSKYLEYITTMYNEYETSINNKIEEGIDKTTINATSVEDIKQYIPSYDDQLYRFKIIKGDLFSLPFKGMTSYKSGLCKNKKIYMLGDISRDNKVTIEDMYNLEDMLATEGDLSDNWSTTELLVADVNRDGTIDSNDIPVLQQIIDGTYE